MKRMKLRGEKVRELRTDDLRVARGGDEADPNIKTFRTVCFGVCASNPCA